MLPANIEYPYRANQRRTSQILNNYARVHVGMSVDDVRAKLGAPDKIHPVYAPTVKTSVPQTIGTRYWYIILQETKQQTWPDSFVLITFDEEDRVKAIESTLPVGNQ